MFDFLSDILKNYTCNALFSVAANAASLIASANVGCACDIREISSAEARYSIATTASAIKSAARAPTIWKPKISSVTLSAKILQIRLNQPKHVHVLKL